MYRITGLIGEFVLKVLVRKNPLSFDQSLKKQEQILSSLIDKAQSTQFGCFK